MNNHTIILKVLNKYSCEELAVIIGEDYVYAYSTWLNNNKKVQSLRGQFYDLLIINK